MSNLNVTFVYLKKGQIPGKRPYGSCSEDSDLEDFINNHRRQQAVSQQDKRQRKDNKEEGEEHKVIDDPHLRRLRDRPVETYELERGCMKRHRRMHESELLGESDSDDNEENAQQEYQRSMKNARNKIEKLSESFDTDSSEYEDNKESGEDNEAPCISESVWENLRTSLRQRMLQQQNLDEIIQKMEQKQSETFKTESFEYEEETESGEDNKPRLIPGSKRSADERRRNALRLVENYLEKTKNDTTDPHIDDIALKMQMMKLSSE